MFKDGPLWIGIIACLISVLIVGCGGVQIGVVQGDNDPIESTATPPPEPSIEVGDAVTPDEGITPTEEKPLGTNDADELTTEGWMIYTNAVYGISLSYPKDWRPVTGYDDPRAGDLRYAGEDGFFHIAAMGGEDLDAVTAAEAEHHLRPYGTRPIIEQLDIYGQAARLILPSADQPAGLDDQAVLIVRYPEPVKITGHTYEYFVMWADQSHILAIGQTLEFQADPQSGSTPPAVVQMWSDLPPGLVYTSSEGLWMIDANETPVRLHPSSQAVLSPDAAYLITYDRVQQDAWLVDRTAGTAWNITRTPDRWECCFQWWPSRPHLVVFNSAAPEDLQAPGQFGYLTIVDLNGESYQVLDPDHDTGAGAFALSPDGETIAYGNGDFAWIHRPEGVEAFDPVAFGLTVAGGLEIAQPAWSHDGTVLAWIVKGNLAPDGGSRTGIGIFDLEAGTGRIIHPYPTQGSGWPSAPVWSPDGEWIVFTDSSPDRPGLWVSHVDDFQTEVYLGRGGNPVWSPTGKWLAFQDASEDGSPHYVVATTDNWQITPLNLAIDRYGQLIDWLNPLELILAP